MSRKGGREGEREKERGGGGEEGCLAQPLAVAAFTFAAAAAICAEKEKQRVT